MKNKKIKFRPIKKEDTNIKTEKNYNRLFRAFEDVFPSWVSLDYISEKYKLNFIFEEDLDELSEQNFLRKKNSFNPRALEDNEEKVRKNFYRLTAEGFNFVNNLNTQKTNALLIILTIALTMIGIIQINLLILRFIK